MVTPVSLATSARPVTNGPSRGSATGASGRSGGPKSCIAASGATTSSAPASAARRTRARSRARLSALSVPARSCSTAARIRSPDSSATAVPSHTVPADLVARMRGFGTTIFAEMTALAVEHGAVNLGQGFPDTDGPPGMLARAAEALGEGLNQYPPGPGVPALREAVAADRLRRYGHTYDPLTEVVVTVGATEAISAAILALCEAGDEVLVLEPYYDSYAAAIALAAAVRVPVPLRPTQAGGRFELDVDALRSAVTPRTKVLLLNSPHNPTGTVLTDDELRAIAGVATEHDLVVVTDEVYEHLVYDGAEHRPLAGYEGMRERTLAVSSAGKTFSVTGWKTGWACGPAHLVRALLTVKQFLTFTNNAPAQVAVAYALEHELAWVGQLRDSLQSRRDQLAAGLRDIGLTVSVPQGTYFLQADVRGLGATDATDFARELPVSHGVVAIPTAAFTDDRALWSPYLRFAFCKQADVLDEAVRRLHSGR